jgi:hypothetical protein
MRKRVYCVRRKKDILIDLYMFLLPNSRASILGGVEASTEALRPLFFLHAKASRVEASAF